MAQYLSLPRIEDPIWLEPVDISFLRHRISEAETQLESLETQISELARHKNAKTVEISSLRNILAPVRRVPLEISLRNLPTSWRKAAHATPRLWSRLCLALEKPSGRALTEVGWVKEWINRSQSFPLDLYLDFYHLPDTSRASDTPHALHMEGELSLLLPLFRLPASSLSQLEEVYLVNWASSDGEVEELMHLEQLETFLGAPKLQHVELKEYNPFSFLLSQTIGTSFGTIITCMLDAAFHDHSALGFSKDFTVTLLVLKSFDVSVNDMPFDLQDTHDLFMDVASFIHRSSTPVMSSLTLFGIWTPSGENEILTQNLIRSLSLFPAISSLRFREYMGPLFRALAFTKDYDPLLPKLRNFELYVPHDMYDHGDLSEFTPTILSRWWLDERKQSDGLGGSLRLKKVVLRCLYEEKIPDDIPHDLGYLWILIQISFSSMPIILSACLVLTVNLPAGTKPHGYVKSSLSRAQVLEKCLGSSVENKDSSTTDGFERTVNASCIDCGKIVVV
ncbi:hypothetical protein BT96DRAFT_1011575 [Gymnopus androsaceus JB14]|uniref:F-box domain-containing protein n=1 Tax=Gymnopus androsaceus JB14 TaxID=1447944 RepID=A0A6A4IJR0_9AGAR|nr:hypothetical protein BT96DRAFT_1011575 [Gymnopus androsaceus JB14]